MEQNIGDKNRILVITHNNNEKSGANRSLLSLLELLKNKYDFDVVVNHSRGNLQMILNGMGITCYRANYDWNYAPRRSNIFIQIYVVIRSILRYYKGNAEINMLVSAIKDNKYSFVYSNTSVIDYGARISDKLNIPHVWHVREFAKEDFQLISLIGKKKRLHYFHEAREIIVISKALMNKYRSMIKEKNMALVYNGFNVNELLSENNIELHKPIEILIAGQLSVAKGQDQAIKAVIKLSEKYDVVLNIAGQGDFDYINKCLNTYGNPQYIKVCGQIDNLYDYRKNIDIELVCSQCEAFGRVTIEAMLHSIPVVAAATGGTRELIKEGVNGFLYEYNNVDELVDKIERLILDKDLREAVAKNGKAFAKDFTIERTSMNVANIFEQIVQENEGK